MKRWIWIAVAVVLIGSGWATQRWLSSKATARSTSGATMYQGVTGKSVLDLLKEHTSVETTTDPQLGEFVTSIDGVKSGTNGRYWIYEVNGQPVATVPGLYQTKPTDTIEWKLN